MPLSEQRKRICGVVILAFLFLQPSEGVVQWAINEWANFSVNAGLRTFIVFQGVGVEILKEAYRAWRGNDASSVVQSKHAECAGHLLDYAIQASILYIYGGQGMREFESHYRELGKSLEHKMVKL